VPHELPDALEIGDDWVLFDSVSGAEAPPYKKLRAKHRLPTAILPTDEGVVFVRWVGADQALDLVAALPFAKRWKRSKQVFVAKGPLVLFDAGLEGRKLGKRAQLPVPLRKGEYSIEHTEVDGWVQGGREVMAGFIRLRRR
jgi:hypothetical protein